MGIRVSMDIIWLIVIILVAGGLGAVWMWAYTHGKED